MGMITLRQLRYLFALAKHGYFGRAAETCAVTQPALSMQIRDLERTLRRRGGGTAAGASEYCHHPLSRTMTARNADGPAQAKRAAEKPPSRAR